MDLVSNRALMRHIIALLFPSLIGSVASSEPPPVSYKQLMPFSKILSLSSDFKQTRLVKEWKAEIKTQGKMQVRNGRKPQVLWQVFQPTYSGVKLEQDRLLFRSQQNAQWVQLENKKVEKTMQQIFTWLRFDLPEIEKDFSIERLAPGHFKFIPRNKSTHFSKIEISFRKAPRLDKIELFEKNDDKITIEFSNTKVQ